MKGIIQVIGIFLHGGEGILLKVEVTQQVILIMFYMGKKRVDPNLPANRCLGLKFYNLLWLFVLNGSRKQKIFTLFTP